MIDTGLRHENIEDNDITINCVGNHEIAVVAELCRVGGKPDGLAIDSLIVSVINFVPVLIVRAERSGVGKEVVVFERPFCSGARVARRRSGFTTKEVSLQPPDVRLSESSLLERGKHLGAGLRPMP